MNPNTLGVLILLVLVLFAEVRSYERVRKTQRRARTTAVSRKA